jgi:hypothetical protein
VLETKYTQDTDEDVVLLKTGWPHLGMSDRVPAMYLWEQLYLMERGDFDRVYDFLCDLRAFEEYVVKLRTTRKPVTFWWQHYKGLTQVTEYDPHAGWPYYKITMNYEGLTFLIERIQPKPFED